MIISVLFLSQMASAVNPLPVELGTAGNFAILSKSGISATGTTSITGDIGVSPIDSTAITGFGLIMDPSNQFSTSSLVNGKVYAADYSAPTPTVMTTAISDMETAYTDAAGRAADVTGLGAGNIGGLVLPPGVYSWGTGVTIPTDVTLMGNANDVWIFQVAQTLEISSGKKVILAGGAQAKNVFWQVAGQSTLGTGSVFNGNILDQTAVVITTGASLNGRALAQTAVTLDSNNATNASLTPGCDCGVLSAPNYVCNLTSDHTSSGTCFNITATNVTILCNGHTITGANGSDSYGIYSDQAQTNVNGCGISNFATGIYFNGATYGAISNTNASTVKAVSGNDGYGILLNSASNNAISNLNATALSGMAIGLNSSTYNTISSSAGTSDISRGISLISSPHNTITGSTGTSAGGAGIYFVSSDNNTISNSRGISTGAQGLTLDSSSYNTFTGFTGTSIDSNGIYLYTASNNIFTNFTGTSIDSVGMAIFSSNNSTLSDFTATSTNSGGIILTLSSSNTITDFTTTSLGVTFSSDGNTLSDFTATNAGITAFTLSSSSNNQISNSRATSGLSFGIHAQAASNNMLSGLTVTSDTGTAFAVDLNSDSNTIRNTTLISINQAGLLLDVASDSDSNTFCLNNFTATSGNYISDTNGANHYNCTYGGIGQTQGNIYANVMSGAVGVNGSNPSSIPSLYIGTSGAVPYDASNSAGGIAGLAIDYAPLTPSYFSNGTNASIANLIVGNSTGGTVNGSAYNITVPATLPISATPGPGYTFSNWSSSGNCTIANATAAATNVSIYGAGICSVTAAFALSASIANLIVGNSTGGTVIGSAYNITVPATLPISATPDPGYTFSNWSASGNCTIANATAASTNVSIYGAGICSVTAAFAVNSTGCVCGVLNVPNYVCNVTTDLASNGTCFDVQAENVTIQGNWHLITGNGANNSYGIYSNRASTRVLRCNINNYGSGIFFSGATNGEIADTTVVGTAMYSNVSYAVYLQNTSGIAISNATISGYLRIAALRLENAQYTAFADGAVNNMAGGNGVRLAMGSNNNVFTNIGAMISGGTGGAAAFAIGHRIDAVDGSGGSNNTFNSCTADATTAPGAYGVVINQGSNGNRFAGLSATTTSQTAVSILNGTDTVIDCAGGAINGTGSIWSYGVYSNQARTSVLNCNINEFAMGARLASNGAVMTGNNITSSAVYGGFGGTMGIFLEGASNGTFSRNMINVSGNSSTWDAAMRLEASSTGNSISDSVLEGGSMAIVVLENSSRNTFTNITAKGATGAIAIAPYNMTSNGREYLGYSDNLVFTGLNVPGTAGTALKNLGSNNLLVDCDGGSLTGSNTNGTYGIHTSRFNTTVKNCNISGFQHGVHFNGATYGTIQNVTASTNQVPGVGIYLLTGSNYNTISDSNLTSASSNGIRIWMSDHNTITNTIGTTGIGDGLYVFSSSYTTITGSTGSSSNGSGVVLYNTANSVLSGSQISGNENIYGALSLRGSANNNTIANSTINGLAGGQAVTFRSEGSNTASGNTLANNTIMNAANLLRLDSDASANLFYWNNFTATNGTHVNDSNGNNIYNTTMFGQGEGNLWADVLDGTVNISGTAFSAYGPGFYLGAEGSGYPYSNITSAKVIGEAADFAPLILGPVIIANLIVTGSVGGTVTGTAYNVTVPATLPINATASTGYAFSGWSRVGNCTINNTASASTTVYLFGAVCNVTASFTSTGSGGGGGGGGSGGSGGGSTGGGGGGSIGSEAYETIPVEICLNVVCNITVTRSISSTNASSVMTTTLENVGGSLCNLEDFAYSDTLPNNFADVDELSFSTPYALRYGQNLVFMFSAFAPGESKTLTYTANRWVPPSRITSFGPPVLSAKRCAAVQFVNETANVTIPPATPAPMTPAPKLEVRPPAAQPAASPVVAASLFSIDFAKLASQYLWMLCPIGIIVALLLLALFLRRKCKNKKCGAKNWPWASKCSKCGRPF